MAGREGRKMTRSNIGFKRILLAAEWTVGGEDGNGEMGLGGYFISLGEVGHV